MNRLLPLLVLILYLVVSLFAISSVPGDWYGDIDVAREYVDGILSGQWPMKFVYGAGPAQYYFATPIVWVLSHWFYGYELLKISTVAMGMLGIWGIYKFGNEVEGEKFGIVITTVASISFWHLVLVRLGNLHIALIPGLVAWILYFFYRLHKTGKFKYCLTGAILSSIGLLIYPGTFILPVGWVVLVTLGLRGRRVIGKALWVSLIASIPILVLFLQIISHQKMDFTSGYIGSKLFGIEGKGLGLLINQAGTNFVKTLGMLHLVGDGTFRMNVPGSSQIDLVSGLLLIVGVLYSIKRNKSYLLLVLIYILFLLPSIYPSLPVAEIPNMARTATVLPIVFFWIGMGLTAVYRAASTQGKKVGIVWLVGCLFLMALLNLHKYFVAYPQILPNQNVPYSKIIARYIDTLPADMRVDFNSCCWGGYGHAERKAIYYQLRYPELRNKFYQETLLESCSEVDEGQGGVIFLRPDDKENINKFKKCFPQAPISTYQTQGQSVFTALELDF